MNIVVLQNNQRRKCRGHARSDADNCKRNLAASLQPGGEACDHETGSAYESDRDGVGTITRYCSDRPPDLARANHGRIAGPIHLGTPDYALAGSPQIMKL